jgi:hypothetical protein
MYDVMENNQEDDGAALRRDDEESAWNNIIPWGLFYNKPPNDIYDYRPNGAPYVPHNNRKYFHERVLRCTMETFRPHEGHRKPPNQPMSGH